MITDIEKCKSTLAKIAADAEQDALTLDGKVLTGKVAGEIFGNIFVSLYGLAKCMEVLCDNSR